MAVEIALANNLHYPTIRRWSEAEDALRSYEDFLAAVRAARRGRRD